MGAPLGYVGCEEGGALAEAVRRSRYQIVTFGEVEKAPRDVLGVPLQVLDGRKIVLELDDKARTWLADKGYDPIYGARPLKRVIQKNVHDPLAELVLEGSVRDGDPVPVSANKAGLTISGQGVKAVAAE